MQAINYPDDARFVRVTGRAPNVLPRLRFDLPTGRAITIGNVAANS